MKAALYSLAASLLVVAAAIIFVGTGSIYRYYPISATPNPTPLTLHSSRWLEASAHGCQPHTGTDIVPYLQCPFWVTP